jgi:hypothetical protein
VKEDLEKDCLSVGLSELRDRLQKSEGVVVIEYYLVGRGWEVGESVRKQATEAKGSEYLYLAS